MPNRNHSSNPGSPKQPRSTPTDDAEQNKPRAARRQKQAQSDGTEEQENDPERVEIGDPVPEDDRTIRARGETGEDEDLPTDDGDIERAPRH